MSRSTKLLLWGTGIASVAVLVMTSACSSKQVDLVGAGRQALDRTEEGSRRAMADAPERVDDGLERFHALFDDYRPGVVSDLARTVYADEVYFNDGFVELTDAEELASYFGRSAEHTAEIGIEIEEIVRTDDGIYLRWIMSFTTTGGTAVVAPGISHLRFNTDGRITYHRDYWDAGSTLAEFVPFAGAILRAVKRRL